MKNIKKLIIIAVVSVIVSSSGVNYDVTQKNITDKMENLQSNIGSKYKTN